MSKGGNRRLAPILLLDLGDMLVQYYQRDEVPPI